MRDGGSPINVPKFYIIPGSRSVFFTKRTNPLGFQHALETTVARDTLPGVSPGVGQAFRVRKPTAFGRHDQLGIHTSTESVGSLTNKHIYNNRGGVGMHANG